MKQRTIQEAVAIAINESGGLSKFAQEVGVSVNTAWQWKESVRKVPAAHCKAVVRASNNKVSLKELRPVDWQKFWPELSRSPEAA